jgi:O-antigen/teichoic acid export membrane protein
MSVEITAMISLAVTFPLTARGLGVEGYGEYTVLYLIFGLAGFWVYSAPSAALVQLILQLDYDSGEVLRLGRRQMLLAVGPVALGGIAISLALLGWDILVSAVLVLGIDFVVTGLASLNVHALFAVDGVVRVSKLRMLQPVLRTAGVLTLAVGGLMSVAALALLNIVVSSVLLARSTLALRRPHLIEGDPKRHPTARELRRYSVLYGTSMSTNALQNEGEKFVLASNRPADEVGQYAAAYRVVSMALVPLTAVVAAANRWFLARDDRPGAQLARVARLSIPAALYGLVAAVVIFLGRDLIQWVAGEDFDEVAVIAAWLCLLPLLHGLAELPPMGLIGLGRNRARVAMGLTTSAIAIVAYLVLVPTFGWRGAVIGTYISESAAIVGGWVFLFRYQQVADNRTLTNAVG